MFSSFQSLSRVWLFATPGLQHARPPCPSQLPQPTQTHVHCIGDAIPPSHPLSSPLLPCTVNLLPPTASSVKRGYVLSRFSCIWLYATPWTVAHQASLSSGVLQARILDLVAWPPPGDLPDSGIEPTKSLISPASANRFLTTRASWEAPVKKSWFLSSLLKYFNVSVFYIYSSSSFVSLVIIWICGIFLCSFVFS